MSTSDRALALGGRSEAGAFDAASLLSALKAMQELEARKGRPGEGAK